MLVCMFNHFVQNKKKQSKSTDLKRNSGTIRQRISMLIDNLFLFNKLDLPSKFVVLKTIINFVYLIIVGKNGRKHQYDFAIGKT